jgi:DNA-directed RNA polymerase specialized sigma24 family protein
MTKVSRAFDTSFEAHKGLLHKMARKGYGRLIDLNVAVDYEDIFQEMSLAYVKAAQKYDVTKGITFSAYLGKTVWNEFNCFVEREQRQNFVSVDSFEVGDDDMDVYGAIASPCQTPEELIEMKQEAQYKNKRSGKLTKYLVSQLLNPSTKLIEAFNREVENATDRVPRDITLSFILKHQTAFDADEVRLAKRQIQTIYGITIR